MQWSCGTKKQRTSSAIVDLKGNKLKAQRAVVKDGDLERNSILQ